MDKSTMKEHCNISEKLPNGKCKGYCKGYAGSDEIDDEPKEACKECKQFELYEE